jgi:glycosyltransferase involved in cell wall biosynthesis
MKLLTIGPRQRAGSDATERQALQAALVERYTILTPREGENNLRAVWRMLWEGMHERADVVSAQDPFFSGLIAWLIARLSRAKLHIQVHTDIDAQSAFKHILAQIMLRHADGIRVVSEKIKAQVLRKGIQAPVSVLPIFVDLALFRAIEHGPHTEKKILWIGRFEEEKDPIAAIEIFKKVHEEFSDSALILLGNGSLESRVHDLADGLPIEFPGWQDPKPFLSSADVVISTSRHESWGASIVEALAAGIPVVAPDIGIAKEAGAIVVSREKLAEAVIEVLRSGQKGELKLSLPTAEAWAREWYKDIEKTIVAV